MVVTSKYWDTPDGLAVMRNFRNPILLALTAILIASLGGISSQAAAPTTQPTALLTIRVTDLRNHKGKLIFGVFASADGFPTDSGKAVNWQIKDSNADTVVFTAQIPPGRYGASVLHDENKNGKLDTNMLGIPLEGYGETNNPKPKTRAATFKESLFDLPPQGATLTISIQYFL
jgi:uncharacterized protein (DUF2141 family)